MKATRIASEDAPQAPTDVPGRPFRRENLFRAVQASCVAHDGCGEILFARIATQDMLSGPCNFIDFTTMPPGSSIGAHRHGALEEEYYLILSGSGRMRCGPEWFDVGAGDFVRNPPGGTHELRNTGAVDLNLFVFELAVR